MVPVRLHVQKGAEPVLLGIPPEVLEVSDRCFLKHKGLSKFPVLIEKGVHVILVVSFLCADWQERKHLHLSEISFQPDSSSLFVAQVCGNDDLPICLLQHVGHRWGWLLSIPLSPGRVGTDLFELREWHHKGCQWFRWEMLGTSNGSVVYLLPDPLEIHVLWLTCFTNPSEYPVSWRWWSDETKNSSVLFFINGGSILGNLHLDFCLRILPTCSWHCNHFHFSMALLRRKLDETTARPDASMRPTINHPCPQNWKFIIVSLGSTWFTVFFSLHFLSVWFGSPNLQQMIIMLVSRKSQCIILVCLKMVYTPPSYRWSFTTGFRDTASDKTMNDVGWYHMLDDDTNHVVLFTWWCSKFQSSNLPGLLDTVKNPQVAVSCWAIDTAVEVQWPKEGAMEEWFQYGFHGVIYCRNGI